MKILFLALLGVSVLLISGRALAVSRATIGGEVDRFISGSKLWIHDSCSIDRDHVRDLLTDGLYNLRKLNPQVVDRIRHTRLYGVLFFVEIRCGELGHGGGLWSGVPFLAGTIHVGDETDDRVLIHEFLHQFGFGGWREKTTDECAYAALDSNPQAEDYPLCAAFRFIL